MNSAAESASEHDEIVRVVQVYIDAARSGRSDDMKSAFHHRAMMFGYFGAELIEWPLAALLEWHDRNGPATDLEARIAGIDVADTVATVRLELDDWTGHRFTDLFTLLKLDGEWKIMNKVFHLHADHSA